MHDHVENKFDQFEILNETFSLSEINWKTLINHALTRFKETESIKLVINSNQHPFQSCTLMGLKDLVKKEKVFNVTNILFKNRLFLLRKKN